MFIPTQLNGKDLRTNWYTMLPKLVIEVQDVIYLMIWDRRCTTLVDSNIVFGCFDDTPLIHCARSRIHW
jgi:hypothetical protein